MNMFYFKIGLRSLIKNKRRSVLTLLTIVIGMTALITANGFFNRSLWGLRESIINGGIGHFQIYKKGFLEHGEENSFQYRFTNYNEIQKELLKVKGIKLIAPRLKFQGIISSADKSVIIFGNAGNAAMERELNTYTRFKDGKNLDDADAYGLVIGNGVARNLAVKAGDPCTIIVTMSDGSVNALDFNVSGITQIQMEDLDNVYALANLATIQKLFNEPGAVDTLVVKLDKTELVRNIEPAIIEICSNFGYEYRRWDQMAPYYKGAKDFFDLIMTIALVLIYTIVIFAVANTMTMTLFERIREIGTIRSLGTTRGKVMKIFISESLLIGVIGGTAGILLGVFIAFLVQLSGGIPMPPPPGGARGYRVFITPGFWNCAGYFLLFLCISAGAVVFPALKAARMAIADTLRWI
jgi:putative ABC transport system permease protein